MRNQYKYEARMFKKKQRIEQGSFWVVTHELPVPKTLPFYRALDAILSEMDFGNKVRKWSAPNYKQDGPGYPGVDSEVYFKMLMVGIFEGIASERGIDARCADSLGIRAFLGYGITEETPCYAMLGNIRRRLSEEVFDNVFGLLQQKLAEEDLLTGTHLGIDPSVIEANASLRELRHKTSGKKYRAYVKDLAREDGVDTDDEGDAEHPSDHFLEAQMRAAEAINPEETDLPIETVTGDRGYYSRREVHTLHAEYGIIPNIPDPILNRNIEKLSAEEQESLETAAQIHEERGLQDAAEEASGIRRTRFCAHA